MVRDEHIHELTIQGAPYCLKLGPPSGDTDNLRIVPKSSSVSPMTRASSSERTARPVASKKRRLMSPTAPAAWSASSSRQLTMLPSRMRIESWRGAPMPTKAMSAARAGKDAGDGGVVQESPARLPVSRHARRGQEHGPSPEEVGEPSRELR